MGRVPRCAGAGKPAAWRPADRSAPYRQTSTRYTRRRSSQPRDHDRRHCEPRGRRQAFTTRLRPRNHPAALAEADPHRALALAVAAEDHLVAVLEERARLAAGQRERLGAAPRALEQAAARFDGVGPETVPLASRSPGRRLQPLLAWCVRSCASVQYMSANDAAAHAHRRLARLAHARRREPHLERDVERAARPVAADARYGSGAGSPAGRGGGRHAERLERVERHDPRRDRRREVLGEERARAAGTPTLCMSRADQSFTRHTPNRCASASSIGDRARRARCPGRRRAPTSSS